MGVGVEDGHGSWSFDWRPKRTVAVEDTPRRWGDESRRGQAPAMGSNFGKIGPSVAELWASASAVWGGGSLMKSFVRCRIFGEGVSSVRTPAQKCYSRM